MDNSLTINLKPTNKDSYEHDRVLHNLTVG